MDKITLLNRLQRLLEDTERGNQSMCPLSAEDIKFLQFLVGIYTICAREDV